MYVKIQYGTAEAGVYNTSTGQAEMCGWIPSWTKFAVFYSTGSFSSGFFIKKRHNCTYTLLIAMNSHVTYLYLNKTQLFFQTHSPWSTVRLLSFERKEKKVSLLSFDTPMFREMCRMDDCRSFLSWKKEKKVGSEIAGA